MKVFVFSAVMMLFVAAPSAAQNSAPTLFDKFNRLPCSDIRGRLDQFLAELSKDENTTGFVVLSGDVQFTEAVGRRVLIENQFLERRFDLRRVRFVRKVGISALGVELWKTLSSVDLPFTYSSEWSYSVPRGTKPFVVYSGGFNDSECSFPSGAGVLGDYLLANSGSRGNIVVRCKDSRCFDDIKNLLLEELKGKGLERSRVRFYYVPIRSQYFQTEFWLLP